MRQLQRFYSLGCAPLSSLQSFAFHHLLLEDFPRHRWTCIAGFSRHFLCLFVIFSQVVLGKVPDCLGTSSVVCATYEELLPTACFADFHLVVSLGALTLGVGTNITASFLSSPCQPLFYGALPSFPPCFPACR